MIALDTFKSYAYDEYSDVSLNYYNSIIKPFDRLYVELPTVEVHLKKVYLPTYLFDWVAYKFKDLTL